jgi:hypothetical protein
MLMVFFVIGLTSCGSLEKNETKTKKESIGRSSNVGPDQESKILSSVTRSNALTPYYEFFYYVRGFCGVSSKEPAVSVFKEDFDKLIIEKLSTQLEKDKENFKIIYEGLKQMKCSLNKEQFTALAKQYKCFMALTQRGCLLYSKEKNDLNKDPVDKEDAFFIKQLETPGNVCEKKWDYSKRKDHFCTVAEGVDINQ